MASDHDRGFPEMSCVEHELRLTIAAEGSLEETVRLKVPSAVDACGASALSGEALRGRGGLLLLPASGCHGALIDAST